MNKLLSRAAALLLALLLLCSLSPAMADLDTGDASTRWYRSRAPERPPHKLDCITIFDQSRYTRDSHPDWALAGYKGRDLASSGCGLFAFAHLLQWLEGAPADEDLLRELIAVCSDPNGAYDHPACTHPKGLDVKVIYGQAFADRIQNLPLPAKTYDGVRAFFSADARRALRVLTGSHIAIAIEEMTVDGVSYIHMVDSNWGTYFYRKGYRYYAWEDGRMVECKYAEGTYGMGSDYWLKTHDMVNIRLLDAWTAVEPTDAS